MRRVTAVCYSSLFGGYLVDMFIPTITYKYGLRIRSEYIECQNNISIITSYETKK